MHFEQTVPSNHQNTFRWFLKEASSEDQKIWKPDIAVKCNNE